MTDLITIVVPVYNVQAHINKTMQSICGQTYQNLQILLIDDGSTDNSLAICKEWAEKDTRVAIYAQENAGAAATRNRGIQLAQGRYLMFMDADDWIEPDMVETLYRLAKEDDADVAGCILKEETPEESEQNNHAQIQEKKHCEVIHGTSREESGLTMLSVWGPVCKLYRTSLIRDIQFQEYKVAEDLLFNTNVICAPEFQKASMIKYPFYHYIIYEGSAMKQEFQEKYLQAMKVEEMCYDKLTQISPAFGDINLIGCSVSRVFEKYAALSRDEKIKYKNDFKACKKFAKEHKKALLETSDRHRKISGWLKVYVPDLYLWTLSRRMRG